MSDTGDEEGPFVGVADTGALLGDVVGRFEVGLLTGLLVAEGRALFSSNGPRKEIKSLGLELPKYQESQGMGYHIASGLVSEFPFAWIFQSLLNLTSRGLSFSLSSDILSFANFSAFTDPGPIR